VPVSTSVVTLKELQVRPMQTLDQHLALLQLAVAIVCDERESAEPPLLPVLSLARPNRLFGSTNSIVTGEGRS
jgi:hypothetical protein